MARVERYYRNRTFGQAAQSFLDLLYVCIVREFRTTAGGAVMSIFMAFIRPIILFMTFVVIFEFLGRGGLIRGDFALFMLTGIFLYLMHIRAVKNLKKAGHGSDGMIFYAKASTLLNILASALHELYVNTVAVILIFTAAYLIRGHLEIYDPANMLLPFFLAWASGLAVGMLFNALSPLAPSLMASLWMMYRRIQMVTSGKMFLGNLVPGSLLPFFQANPLFHCIDQARGAAFINYMPRNSNIEYPLYFTFWVIFVALLIEFALNAARARGIE